MAFWDSEIRHFILRELGIGYFFQNSDNETLYGMLDFTVFVSRMWDSIIFIYPIIFTSGNLRRVLFMGNFNYTLPFSGIARLTQLSENDEINKLGYGNGNPRIASFAVSCSRNLII